MNAGLDLRVVDLGQAERLSSLIPATTLARMAWSMPGGFVKYSTGSPVAWK